MRGCLRSKCGLGNLSTRVRRLWAEMAQSVYRLATGWTVRASNPSGGEIFLTRSQRPWFSWVKRPGRIVSHPPPFRAEVKERAELHLYSHLGLHGML